jgi:hypothetical protein
VAAAAAVAAAAGAAAAVAAAAAAAVAAAAAAAAVGARHECELTAARAQVCGTVSFGSASWQLLGSFLLVVLLGGNSFGLRAEAACAAEARHGPELAAGRAQVRGVAGRGMF